MTILLVCGGRDFGMHLAHNKAWAWDCLDLMYDDSVVLQTGKVRCVIQGGALGADQIAREWAEHNDIMCLTFEARWDVYGPAAGPRRNQEMIEFGPEYCLVLPGGVGTKDMCERVRKAGIGLWIPTYDRNYWEQRRIAE